MSDVDDIAINMVSAIASSIGVEDCSDESVNLVVEGLLATDVRTYLRSAVRRDLRRLLRSVSPGGGQRRGSSSRKNKDGVLAIVRQRSEIYTEAPEAMFVPIFPHGRRGWLGLARTAPDGSDRHFLEWTKRDVLEARDAYRAAGKRAMHHAQFMQGIAESMPDGRVVGEVFTARQLKAIWNALTVSVNVNAEVDRQLLAQQLVAESQY